MNQKVERRSHTRFRTQLPVVFHWSTGGVEHEGAGFSRDISASGIYVVAETCPPVSSFVMLDVMVAPPREVNRLVKLAGSGEVVREIANHGFAIGGQFSLAANAAAE